MPAGGTPDDAAARWEAGLPCAHAERPMGDGARLLRDGPRELRLRMARGGQQALRPHLRRGGGQPALAPQTAAAGGGLAVLLAPAARAKGLLRRMPRGEDGPALRGAKPLLLPPRLLGPRPVRRRLLLVRRRLVWHRLLGARGRARGAQLAAAAAAAEPGGTVAVAYLRVRHAVGVHDTQFAVARRACGGPEPRHRPGLQPVVPQCGVTLRDGARPP
mmetsp:Transcript_12153/g.38692  ORF Transcript_12153/g.38692 Transcript_12153/m.38692 type:complete len:217 (-) Transcript_12153:1363-2013(-)